MAETEYIPAGSALHQAFHAVSQEALKITTPHFRKYKEGTPHMIKSLELVPMRPLDAEHMNRIFRKEGI